MVIGEIALEVIRTGNVAKLVLRARPFSHETPITFDELESLALFFANERGKWHELIEADSKALS